MYKEKLENELAMINKSIRRLEKGFSKSVKRKNRRYSDGYVSSVAKACYIKGKLDLLNNNKELYMALQDIEQEFEDDSSLNYIG